MFSTNKEEMNHFVDKNAEECYRSCREHFLHKWIDF